MSENGEIYTAGKNFTLPPALTALTNSTSGARLVAIDSKGKMMKLWERFKELDTKIVTSSLMCLKEDAF